VADVYISNKTQSTSVLVDCSWVFIYAADSNPQIALMFLNEDKILERVYQKLYHSDLQVKLATLKVFSAISGAIENEDEHTFLTMEFMSALEALIKSPSAEVRQHVAFLFSNLTCSTPRDLEKILDHSLFTGFLGQMRTEATLGVMKDMALSAANLVKLCNDGQLLRLARFDLIGSILALADQAEKNHKVLQLCFRAIAEMIERGEELRGSYGGVNPILNEVASQETLYHRLSQSMEAIPTLPDRERLALQHIDDLLLTHTNIYN